MSRAGLIVRPGSIRCISARGMATGPVPPPPPPRCAAAGAETHSAIAMPVMVMVFIFALLRIEERAAAPSEALTRREKPFGRSVSAEAAHPFATLLKALTSLDSRLTTASSRSALSICSPCSRIVRRRPAPCGSAPGHGRAASSARAVRPIGRTGMAMEPEFPPGARPRSPAGAGFRPGLAPGGAGSAGVTALGAGDSPRFGDDRRFLDRGHWRDRRRTLCRRPGRRGYGGQRRRLSCRNRLESTAGCGQAIEPPRRSRRRRPDSEAEAMPARESAVAAGPRRSRPGKPAMRRAAAGRGSCGSAPRRRRPARPARGRIGGTYSASSASSACSFIRPLLPREAPCA